MLRLEVEDQASWENPSPREIAEALAALDGEQIHFAILSRAEDVFLQTWGPVQGGFDLEYHTAEGDHFCCQDCLTLHDVTRAFQSDARGEEGWRKDYRWEPDRMFGKKKPSAKADRGQTTGVPSALKDPEGLSTRIIFILFGLVFLAGLLGIKKVIPEKASGSLFFGLIGLIFCVDTTGELLSGQIKRKRCMPLLRSENPIQFRLSIIFGYVVALVFLTVALCVVIRG